MKVRKYSSRRNTEIANCPQENHPLKVARDHEVNVLRDLGSDLPDLGNDLPDWGSDLPDWGSDLPDRNSDVHH